MNHEEFVNAIAAKLGEKPLFKGAQAPFRLYAHVPLQCIRDDGTYFGYEDTFDLVVCRGNQVAMRFPEIKGPRPSHASSHYFSNATMAFQTADLANDRAEARYREIQKKLDGPPSPTRRSVQTLDVVEVETLIDHPRRNVRQHLIKARLLIPSGEFTDFGRACGVFRQYGRGKNPSSATYVVEAHAAGTLRDALTRGGATRPDLAQRFKRVQAGYPSDDRYGAYVAGSLTKLLQTSLKELCGRDKIALAEVTRALSAVGFLLEAEHDITYNIDWRYAIHDAWEIVHGNKRTLPGGKVGETTYGSALKAVYDIVQLGDHMANEEHILELKELGGHLLTLLARQLVRPREALPQDAARVMSLQHRLETLAAPPTGDISVTPTGDEENIPAARAALFRTLKTKTRAPEFPFLNLPVFHYFYAAALLDGSDYPLWFASTHTCHSQNSRSLYFAFHVKWGLGDVPGLSEVSTAYLYDLMVEPIFPSLGERDFPCMELIARPVASQAANQ